MKRGPIFDLPIAVGLLLAGYVIQTQRLRRLLFAGELALDEGVRSVSGVVNLAILCKHLKLDGVVVPVENAGEASAVGGIEVYPVDTLASVVGFLNEQHEIEPLPEVNAEATPKPPQRHGLRRCTRAGSGQACDADRGGRR
ncbi:MAG: magnesium chelatase domain-containing protein [Phycisphaerales bacterium]